MSRVSSLQDIITASECRNPLSTPDEMSRFVEATRPARIGPDEHVGAHLDFFLLIQLFPSEH